MQLVEYLITLAARLGQSQAESSPPPDPPEADQAMIEIIPAITTADVAIMMAFWVALSLSQMDRSWMMSCFRYSDITTSGELRRFYEKDLKDFRDCSDERNRREYGIEGKMKSEK
jgi:hypothetical protein